VKTLEGRLDSLRESGLSFCPEAEESTPAARSAAEGSDSSEPMQP